MFLNVPFIDNPSSSMLIFPRSIRCPSIKRPDTPKTSDMNVDNLKPLLCRNFSIRFLCVLTSWTIFFLYRVKSLNSRVSLFGIKLPVSRPALNRLAIHSESFTSVFLPGTFLCLSIAFLGYYLLVLCIIHVWVPPSDIC